MLKLGGKYDYTYESNGKVVLKQKRLNILKFGISIPLKTLVDNRRKDEVKE